LTVTESIGTAVISLVAAFFQAEVLNISGGGSFYFGSAGGRSRFGEERLNVCFPEEEVWAMVCDFPGVDLRSESEFELKLSSLDMRAVFISFELDDIVVDSDSEEEIDSLSICFCF